MSEKRVDEYRKREIEFTSLKNVIAYCSMINQKSFDLYKMAEVLNTDYEFLRCWTSRNLWLINRVLKEYAGEILEKIKRRSEGGAGQEGGDPGLSEDSGDVEPGGGQGEDFGEGPAR